MSHKPVRDIGFDTWSMPRRGSSTMLLRVRRADCHAERAVTLLCKWQGFYIRASTHAG